MLSINKSAPFSMCVYRIPQGTNYTRAACDYCYAHQRSHYVSPLRSWGPNIMPYLTTLALGDPRGANYVRTTRDLSPLVLSNSSYYLTKPPCRNPSGITYSDATLDLLLAVLSSNKTRKRKRCFRFLVLLLP